MKMKNDRQDPNLKKLQKFHEAVVQGCSAIRTVMQILKTIKTLDAG